MHEEEIRKNLTSKKLVIGKDEVLKNIRKGNGDSGRSSCP